MARGVVTSLTAGGEKHYVSSSLYGTCDTAAATAAKIVKLTEAITDTAWLVTGMLLCVKFTNANGVANPTLTIQNSSGTQLIAAKNIMRYGTTRPSTNAASSWTAGAVVPFVYDGTNWVETSSWDNNSNTIPSIYCDTAAATAAKVGQLSGGALVKGYYTINITAANTSATALTLNINGKGAKAIYINGAASSTSNYTLPAGFYIIYYDGTNFHFRTDGKIPSLIASGSLTTTSMSPITKKTVVTGVTKKTVGTSVTKTAIATSAVSNGVLDLTAVLTNVVLNTGDSVTVSTGDSVTVGTAVNVVTGNVT